MRPPEDEIRDYLRRIAAPPDDEIDEFVAKGRRALLAKGEPLSRLGDTEHRLAFLHTGIVRYHVLVPQTGEDVTKDFSFAKSFAVSYGSAVTGGPVRVAISAVEDCAVTLWGHYEMAAMFDRHAEWQKLGRKIAEMLYVRKENRELSFLLESAAERYRKALVEFPPDVARIPQHRLASYLGVTPESLSRMRRHLPP